MKWLTDLTRFFISGNIIALAMICYEETTLGFEIRAVGLNPDAARYAGMSAKRNATIAMAISGVWQV